ncbi:MAG: phosphotransferase [Geminicoccaceae bacterium]
MVRIGDTVRRPRTANSGFIRLLLDHLGAGGFDGAPAFLGIDGQGRDIFSYIEGNVPRELDHHEDDVLDAAAALIRRYHDATADLAARVGHAGSGRIEVVCHGDLSPCNTVFRDGLPVALIDFDAAATGCRLDDLGYAAWLWLDLGNPSRRPDEQRPRLLRFAAAYEFAGDIPTLVTAVLERQARLAARAPGATAAWARECMSWTLRHRQVLGDS